MEAITGLLGLFGGLVLGYFLRDIREKIASLVQALIATKKPQDVSEPASKLVEPLSPIQEAARRMRGDIDRLNS